MGMYFESELKYLDIDEILSGIRWIDPEDLVVLYEEKIRRLESALRKTEDGNANLVKENKRLKEELNVKLTEVSKKLLNSIYGKDSAEWNELVTENRRLLEKQANLESQINVLNTVSDGYKDKIDELTQENEKLKNNLGSEVKYRKSISIHNAELQKENERLQEELEWVKASSDLTMTDEMACILGEYVDGNQKNYEKLVSKLTDFRDKHNLIVVAGELKRG